MTPLPLDAWHAAHGAKMGEFAGYSMPLYYTRPLDEHQLGFAAADGGELLAPPPTLLGETQWKALTKAFLGT